MALIFALSANLEGSTETKRLPIIALVIFTVTLVAFWATSVTTLTLYATADSYSWESIPLSNNGHSDNFQITSAYVNPKNMRGWVAFNVSGIPSNAWIITAQFQLRIWIKSINNATSIPPTGDSTGRIYGVYRITQPWGEEEVTWANQPNYTTERLATAAVPPGQPTHPFNSSLPPLYMDWDIASIVRDWQSGAPNYGLVVKDTQENSPILYSTQFFTHEKVPDESYYPKLTVTYVMPQSLVILSGVLFLEALSITMLWRRQRKHMAENMKE